MISKKLIKEVVDEIYNMFPVAMVFVLCDVIMWIWYDEADQAIIWGE